MNSLLRTWPSIRQWLRRLVYLSILTGLLIYLIRQGTAPWIQLAAHWHAFIAVLTIGLAGYLVQVVTFCECLPLASHKPPLGLVLRIWATAGISSLLAPLMAGLAVRAVLLKQAGVGLREIGVASLRQTWFNLEYALILSAVMLLVFPWPAAPNLGWILTALGTVAWLARRTAAAGILPSALKMPNFVGDLVRPPTLSAMPWLWGQILLMALNYFAAFNLIGAPLTVHESILLAAFTILTSVAVFIPNGLGILDGLWVWLGQHQGLGSNEAITLALTLRLGNLAASLLLWGALTLPTPWLRNGR